MGTPEIPGIPENFNFKFDKIVIGGFILLSTINIFLFINYVQKLDYYIKYATYMQHECDNQITLEKYTMRSIMFNNKDSLSIKKGAFYYTSIILVVYLVILFAIIFSKIFLKITSDYHPDTIPIQILIPILIGLLNIFIFVMTYNYINIINNLDIYGTTISQIEGELKSYIFTGPIPITSDIASLFNDSTPLLKYEKILLNRITRIEKLSSFNDAITNFNNAINTNNMQYIINYIDFYNDQSYLLQIYIAYTLSTKGNASAVGSSGANGGLGIYSIFEPIPDTYVGAGNGIKLLQNANGTGTGNENGNLPGSLAYVCIIIQRVIVSKMGNLQETNDTNFSNTVDAVITDYNNSFNYLMTNGVNTEGGAGPAYYASFIDYTNDLPLIYNIESIDQTIRNIKTLSDYNNVNILYDTYVDTHYTGRNYTPYNSNFETGVLNMKFMGLIVLALLLYIVFRSILFNQLMSLQNIIIVFLMCFFTVLFILSIILRF